MKRKKLLIIPVALVTCAYALTSCKRANEDTSNDKTTEQTNESSSTTTNHEHKYSSEWSYDDSKHWHASICEHDLKDEEADHTIENGKCTVCGYKEPTQGVSYTLSDDSTYYIVSGVEEGVTLSGDLVIANTYEGKPVTTIGQLAFLQCEGITSITIPSSITSIEYGAFGYCTGLTSLTIPSNVVELGKSAFAYCNNLISLTIEEGVTTLGKSVFAECTNLESVILPNSVTTISDSLFSECTNLKNVTLGNNITKIESSAFDDCDGLTNIVLPESVEVIDSYAFFSCSNLANINIPNKVSQIGYRAFEYCTNLNCQEYDNGYYLGNTENPYLAFVKAKTTEITSCTINDNCKFILDNGFNGCLSVTSVVIPNSVVFINRDAFYNCNIFNYNEYDNAYYLGNTENPYLVLIEAKAKDITSCTINENCKFIYDNAFDNCTSLTSITLPDSVISIGKMTFQACIALKNIKLSNNLSYIGESAFQVCRQLTSIVIPTSLTKLDVLVFERCDNFKTVYYMGNIEEWNNIENIDDNTALTSREIYYYSETKPTTDGNYWHYVDGTPTIWTE